MSRYLEIDSGGSATEDDSQVLVENVLNRYRGREDELLRYLQSRCGQDGAESVRHTRNLETDEQVGRQDGVSASANMSLGELNMDFSKIAREHRHHLSSSVPGLSIQFNESASSNPSRLRSFSVNKTPLKDRHPLEFTVICSVGFILAANAGFINGIALSEVSHLPVSHLSGTSSKLGLAVSSGHKADAVVNFGLIGCFVVGSTISGFIVPDSSFHITMGYGPLFIIGAGLLILACTVQAMQQPGEKGHLYLAAMACGLQNAMTTKYSGSIIRTTHVTGSFTDIGIVIGRILRGQYDEVWKLQILIPLCLGFIIGGMIAQVVYPRMPNYCLALSASLYIFLWGAHSLFVYQYSHSLWTSSILPVSDRIKDTVQRITIFNPLQSVREERSNNKKNIEVDNL